MVLSRADGTERFFRTEEVQGALASGEWAVPAGVSPTVDTEFGPSAISPDQLPDALASGQHQFADPGAVGQVVDERTREDYYGGTTGKLAAAGLGVARGVSLGGSDVLLSQIAGDDAREYAQGVREQNPYLSLGTEVIGAVLPAVLSGGQSSTASVARLAPSAMAIRFSKAAGGSSLVRRGVAEGLIFGAAEGTSQLALSDQPVNAERFAHVMGSNMLIGGVAGGAGGLAGKALEKGMSKARNALAKRAAKVADVTTEGSSEFGLDALDMAGLRARDKAAVAVELDRLRQVRAWEGEELVSGLKGFSSSLEDAGNLFALTKGAAKGSPLADAAGSLARGRKRLDAALKLDIQTAARPSKVRDAIDFYEHALRTIKDQGDEIARKAGAPAAALDEMASKQQQLEKALDDVLDRQRRLKEVGGFKSADAMDAHNAASRSIDTEASKLRAKVKAGQEALDHATRQVNPESVRLQQLSQVDDLLEQAQGFREKITELTQKIEPGMTAEREAIRNAMDVLRAPKPPVEKAGFIEKTVKTVGTGAIATAFGGSPVAWMGAAAIADKVGNLVFKRAGTAAGEQSARLAKALDAILDTSNKSYSAGVPLTKTVLAGVKYADIEHDEGVGTFAKRAAEIRSHLNAQGEMSAGSKAKVAERLAPVAAGDPVLADQIETVAARKVAYLASELPKMPGLGWFDAPGWEPSRADQSSFARRVAAAEDPVGVLERASAGNMTTEDVETLKAVYPEMYKEIQNEIATRIPELRKNLPYQRRLMLSILFGLPVDASLEPHIIAVLQEAFVGAGVPSFDPPQAQNNPSPQMGAITPELGTPAQERQK